MLGWLADFFRLAWGLLYWNTRKSLFQLRRGRMRCPCQSSSDSGRAMETRCDACLHWAKPSRFKRVCPLLVDTPDGLRCSADSADVRPFWNITGRYYGGTLAAIYAAGVIGVFAFLRTVGYPISIVHVAWPGLWYRIPQARGWFYVERANRAFAAGRTSEGVLYLVNAYQFDPANYAVGLSLARQYQLLQPGMSDQLFQRLMRDFPEHRDGTAQDWYRALLVRGDFRKAAQLAAKEILSDPVHANVWTRGLLFTTQRNLDDQPLRGLLASAAPEARPWRQVLETELLMRAKRTAEARAALGRKWPMQAPPFTIFYQAATLASLGTFDDIVGALDLLSRRDNPLPQNTRYTLELDILAAADSRKLLLSRVDQLLAQPMHGVEMLPTFTLLSAHLIRFPDQEIFLRLMSRVGRERIPFDNNSAGVWFSLICAAGAVGDQARLHVMTVQLRQAAHASFAALGAVEAFFRGQSAARRATSFLPILPLPLEVTYAMLERYPGPATAPTPVKRP